MAHRPEGATLFEASWEVCNKVGGIHTVLTTKLHYAQKYVNGKYFAIGPWVGNQPNFHEEPLPPAFQAAAASLAKQGVDIHYGRWLVDGNPETFLIGWYGLASKADAIKSQYWNDHQLDSLHADPNDVDPPLLWSTAVGMFIKEMAAQNSSTILFHGHEWLSAGAFLQVSKIENVKSVFTTHATVLGRALSSRGVNIYAELETVNPLEAAQSCGVTTKHQLESLSARLSTVFTTVSAITAREATAYLGRTPDVITENGVDPEQFPDFDRIGSTRNRMREELDRFMAAYFFPSYRFDLRNTSYYFTMGRYETHNKGYDLSLKSLSDLNEELKHQQSDKTVIACFFVPGDALRIRPEVLFQSAAQRQIRTVLTDYSILQQHALYAGLWSDEEDGTHIEVLPAHVLEEIKQLILRLPVYKEVPVSPFDLRNPEEDSILSLSKQYGLNNTEEDRVKVLFFPAYFDGFDGIFNRSLYELISGCDLGFFPSLYEPWGYTPMESLAMGLPGITSNLAGFGIAVQERLGDKAGTWILNRDNTPDDVAGKELTQLFGKFLTLTPRGRLALRMEAYLAIQQFSWSQLFERYKETYDKALA